ncbi:MAG: RnfH family protein [Pseudomonadota bacterium]
MDNLIAGSLADVADTISVQVCYAKLHTQFLRAMQLPAGSTLEQAIHASGVLAIVPEIDLSGCKVGIYSHIKPLNTILRDGDRVEIYRPLIADPKESRRRRADKRDNAKAG